MPDTTKPDRWHVRRERVKDTSVSFTQGGVPARPGVGSVRCSKMFRAERAAQREADAWNGAGDFAKHGPTDWQAEVREGRAPRQAEAEARVMTPVPPELRELLTLMRDLAQPLPMPEKGTHGWDARHDREISRHSMLSVRLDSLIDQMEIGDQYPSVAAECLSWYCTRTTEAIRRELAKPLGYEAEKPQNEPEAVA